LFKGYYYVRTPEELRLRNPRYNPLELFALAATRKGIGSWYYGLDTALRLNGMTHEDRRVETVVSDSFYRIHGVLVGASRFVIHKWRHELVTFGLVDKGVYRHSDPEKTVLDLLYWDYWRAAKGKPETRAWVDYLANVRTSKLRMYLRHYPEAVARSVEGFL
jgi:hypothetical protein